MFPFLSELVRDEYISIFKTGNILNTEERYVILEKEIFTETRKIPVFDGDKVIRIITVIRNITERKKDEEMLRLLSSAVEQSSEGLSVVDLDGNIIFANNAFTDFHGYTPEELPGENLSIFHTPEQMPSVDAANRQIKETGGFIGEIWHVRKDGTIFPAMMQNSLLRDMNGKPIGMIGTLRDITERKEAEESLSESEKRFKDISNSMADWIWEVDENGVYTYCSEKVENILGYTKEETIGRTPFDIMPPEEAIRVKEIFLNIAENKKPIRDLENWNLTKEGKRICLLTNGIPILDDKGNLKGYRGVDKDITGRKRLEEQLLQAQKMEAVGRLAGGIAHDFNNMLMAVSGYSELLLNKLEEDDPLRQDINEILKAAGRAASLTRQLLAFSRRQMLQTRVLDINVVIEDMRKMLKPIIGEDIELITELETDLEHINADPGQVEQIIMNLALNAQDAMPDGGKLIVKTGNVIIDDKSKIFSADARPGNFVCMTIEDNGFGMNKDALKQIFEPFFSTKEVGKGTGLGLSVVYGIVKQHNGWINVYSEEDTGSVFKIYLPAFSKEIEAKAVKSIPVKDINGRGEGILVVEDDDEVLDFVSRVLLEKKYNIFKASDASEALKIFKRKKDSIQLVFSDIILPDKNGIKLVDELLAIKPGLLVLLNSGYSDEKAHGIEIRKKGFRFIQKPYSLTELYQAIVNALGRDM